MAASRIYSTAAYYVAAIVAIIFGLSPKFGAVVEATPGAVLGGITVVLYGMIGLLGAKIWKENGVNLANPINLIPVAAGIILAIGNVDLKFTDNFSLSGIALGTVVAILGYHLARVIAPPHMKAEIAAQRPAATPELDEVDEAGDFRVEDESVPEPRPATEDESVPEPRAAT
jgi:xanthine/uracil permease